LAFGITAPEGSVTVPEIDPVMMPWAYVAAGRKEAIAASARGSEYIFSFIFEDLGEIQLWWYGLGRLGEV
jgi:hypothetical protein